MSKKPQVQMPQSTAGLIRYFDESKEAVKLKPEHVAAICIALSAAILVTRFMIFV
jgi:preprotein translocase subunit Sec61beta